MAQNIKIMPLCTSDVNSCDHLIKIKKNSEIIISNFQQLLLFDQMKCNNVTYHHYVSVQHQSKLLAANGYTLLIPANDNYSLIEA